MTTFMILTGALLVIGGACYIFRAAIGEKIKGYRTIIWNALVGSSPIVMFILDKLGAVDWTQFLTPGWVIVAGIVIGGIGIWLRSLTTGPVGSKGDEEPASATKAGD